MNSTVEGKTEVQIKMEALVSLENIINYLMLFALHDFVNVAVDIFEI